MFNTIHWQLYEGSSFPSVSSAEHPVQQNLEEEENIIQMAQHSVRNWKKKIFSTSVSCIRESGNIAQWGTLLNQLMQHLEPGVMRRDWYSANGLMHAYICTLFINKAQFTCDGFISIRNFDLWAHENPWGRVLSNFQYCFSVIACCGILGELLIGSYITHKCQTGDSYPSFSQNEFPAIVKDSSFHTRLQMHLQHEGAPPTFQYTWHSTWTYITSCSFITNSMELSPS
jgi:hypothetical protein